MQAATGTNAARNQRVESSPEMSFVASFCSKPAIPQLLPRQQFTKIDCSVERAAGESREPEEEMAAQYIYTMKGLTKIRPVNREVLKDIFSGPWHP